MILIASPQPVREVRFQQSSPPLKGVVTSSDAVLLLHTHPKMYAEQKIPKMYEYRKKRIVKEADIRWYHDVRTIFSVHSLF
jgi:hypothetical protein